MNRINNIVCVFFAVFFTFSLISVEAQNLPVCTRYGVTLNVSEVELIGFLVYNLGCTDADNDTLTYNLNSNGNTFNKFLVTPTGEVRLNKRLNADFTYKYNLHITVTDDSASAHSVTVLIGILVLNINDNDPKFKTFQSVINVREDTMIGTKLSTCEVKDKDKKQESLAGQTRVGIIKPFSPAARRWVIDAETCDFYVNTLLDYEHKKGYVIGIIARDLDPLHPRTVTTSVTINVLDVNDNYPKCKEHYKILGIPEDQNIGSTITKFSCTDADSGVNGNIFYRIADSNPQPVKDSFTVTLNGGELQLHRAVDYETSPFYDIDVHVYDGGDPSLTSTIIVGVVLTDVDDNIPMWAVDPLTLNVLETTPLGTVVFAVSATDIDAKDTFASAIKYGIKTKPNPDWFHIDYETGGVYVTNIMNWLTAPWVTMEVFAYSSDKINDYNVVTINITLIDENNVAPKFEQNFYQGNISEDDPTNTYIFTVKASDPENGVNGEVRYKMDSTVFQVDSISGDVTLKELVDFETHTVFSMNVEAYDLGTPVQRGYTFLLINVLPVNEFTPIIYGLLEPITIPEDTEPGTILHHFNFTDDDTGFDGSVTFTVKDHFQPFTVEPKSGVFHIGSPLDRESIPKWVVVIIAKDASEANPKSSSTTVTVILDDVNDHNPICEPLSNTVVKLPHVIGDVLTTISCTDDDIGINADFTYTKVSGDDKNSFSINSDTGEIILAKNPTETKYTLTIIVEDKGNPKLNVIIAFNIIAELQFNFTNIPVVVHIPENTVLAYELYNIDACCVFSLIHYTILSGNDDHHVIIDPASGKLILMNSFDREIKTSFRFNIKALSLDTNSTAESFIDVIIDDSNDNTPKFDTNFLYQSVSEDIIKTTSIIQITATDLDAGKNSELVYAISEGNSGTKFEIDQLGNLMLILDLDAETINQYSLIITATDKGDLPLIGSSTIVIDVKNVNEFSPQIVNIQDGVISKNVFEDETLGAPIFSIKAEDQDINTAFTYSITKGNSEKTFVIDGSSGDIYLAKILDRETTDQYNITVEVETSNGEKVSALVVIDVLDVNDKDPKFAQDVYQLEVTHEDLPNKAITTFIITDGDIGVNKDIVSVTITDGDPSNHFKIVGNEIQTNITIDYYDQKIYSLTLQAVDGGVPPRSGFTHVVINVLPKFKPPRFLSNDYNKIVLEDVSSGDDVFDLDATVDGGKEGNFGTIKYSIRSGNNDNDFYISDTTGIIRVTSSLDFENIESYTFIIDAKSKENPLLSASTTLSIIVENINDNVPIFTLRVYDLSINEDASVDSSVGTVTAIDLDKDPHRTITYILGSTTGSSDFTIDNNGLITTANPLDYRTRNVYSIPVLANDGGVVQGEALAVIRINDVNDNAPTFKPDTVSIEVVESTGTGDIFHTVKAEDLDTGINGEIIYTIVSGNYNNQLGLNINSGALTVASSLDRESYNRFDLKIIAEDKAATNRKSGTLILTVNVADVNDMDPTFSKSIEDATIIRADPPGSAVITVSASDADEGVNAAIVYEITNGNTDGLFLIDGNNGQVKTASSVGTAENEYNLVITAKDKGIPSRSGTMTLKVQIRPFKVSGPSEQSMEVDEDLPSGQPLSSVTPKAGHDGAAVIKYSIVGGNFKNSFEINEDSGAISTQRKLDREEYPSYILSVDITDNNGVAYIKTVSVDVRDINDNNPVITTTDANINVVENTPVGHIVAGFTVSDADSGPGGETDLSISTSPAAAGHYFEFNGRFMVVKTPVDYETIKTITFSVLAVDRGTPKRTGSVDITVTVIDVNDSELIKQGGEAPSVYISTETSYKASNGELVTTIAVSDFGIDPGAETVKFTTLNREGIFAMSEEGIVTVQKSELLQPELKYFVWAVATAVNSENKSSVLGLLRIDTFDPNKHLVALESNTDAATLESFRDEMVDSLKQYFSLVDVPKIWKIQPFQTTSRRKLLATSSESLVYVIKGPVSYDIADIEERKTFMDMTDMLNVLRMVPNQDTPHPNLETPNFPVVAVNGYYIPEPPTLGGSQTPTFTSSLDGYITFAFLAILLLLILIIILIFCCYKKKKREQKRHNESSDSLVPVEPKKIQKLEIKKPKGKGKKKTPPLSTSFGDLPTNKTTRRTSQTSIDSTLLGSGLSAQSPSDIQARLSPMTPIGTTTSSLSKVSLLTDESSKRTSKIKPIEKRILPLPKVQDEKKASTIDLSKEDKINDNQPESNAVVTKRKNGPIVNRGKEYDGVGYDTAFVKSIYSNSDKTDSDIWSELEDGEHTLQSREIDTQQEPQSQAYDVKTLDATMLDDACQKDTENKSISSGYQSAQSSAARMSRENKDPCLKPVFINSNIKQKHTPRPPNSNKDGIIRSKTELNNGERNNSKQIMFITNKTSLTDTDHRPVWGKSKLCESVNSTKTISNFPISKYNTIKAGRHPNWRDPISKDPFYSGWLKSVLRKKNVPLYKTQDLMADDAKVLDTLDAHDANNGINSGSDYQSDDEVVSDDHDQKIDIHKPQTDLSISQYTVKVSSKYPPHLSNRQSSKRTNHLTDVAGN